MLSKMVENVKKTSVGNMINLGGRCYAKKFRMFKLAGLYTTSNM